jgi:hypothetical protein
VPDRSASRTFRLGRDIERDQHDESDGEHERAEHQPRDLVGARLIDRQPLGEFPGYSDL